MSSDDFRSSSHLSLPVGGFTAPIHTCIHRILVQQRRLRLGQHMSVNGGYDDRRHPQLGPGNRICMVIFSLTFIHPPLVFIERSIRSRQDRLYDQV